MESPSRTLFEKGRAYPRRQIRDALGGSARAALPTQKGRVTCVCARRKMNPRAPGEILLPPGGLAARAAHALAGSGEAVPVFVGERDGEWTYAGLWLAERLEGGAGEESLVLLLRELPAGAAPAAAGPQAEG